MQKKLQKPPVTLTSVTNDRWEFTLNIHESHITFAELHQTSNDIAIAS